MIEPETRHEPCLFLYKLMIHSGKLLLSGYTFTALFLPVEKRICSIATLLWLISYLYNNPGADPNEAVDNPNALMIFF